MLTGVEFQSRNPMSAFLAERHIATTNASVRFQLDQPSGNLECGALSTTDARAKSAVPDGRRHKKLEQTAETVFSKFSKGADANK